MYWKVAAALMCLPTSALGQTPSVPTDFDLESLQQASVRQGNQSADLDVRTGFAGSGVQVSASSDATNVMLTLARSTDASDGENLDFWNGALVLTAPITDKDRKEGAFVTEGGLPASYSAQLTLSHTWMTDVGPLPGTQAARSALFQRALARCRERAATEAAGTQCATLHADALMSNLTVAERRELADSFDDAPLWRVGFSGTIGRRELEFRRLSDLAKDSVSRTEFSGSGFFGWSPGSSPTYLGAGFEYRRQYKNLPARTLCPAVAPGAIQECFTASFGEPGRQVDSVIFGVARWQGTISLLGASPLPIGIEVRAGYDLHDNVFGVSVPIYFLSGADGLRGGVRFNWQDVDDEDERFSFGVFVGTTFSLFGG